MKNNMMDYGEMAHDARRALEREREELTEQAEAKVVTVQGNYNDIHDNDNVKLNEKEK